MKSIITLVLSLLSLGINAQFINWNQEDTPGHNLYLHGEGGNQFFAVSFALRLEYTYENIAQENLAHYSIGLLAGRTIGSVEHITNFHFANYIGPFIGIQIGRKRHRLESTFGVGLFHENRLFKLPSRSTWIPNFTLGYRNRGTLTNFRIGVGFPNGIYMSFGNRLF